MKKVVLAKITPLRANKDVNMVNAVLNNVTNVDSTARILAGMLAITESYWEKSWKINASTLSKNKVGENIV